MPKAEDEEEQDEDDEEEEEEIYDSHSLEIEDEDNFTSLSISALGAPEDYDFIVTYGRPKIKKILGLFKKVDFSFNDLSGQTQ